MMLFSIIPILLTLGSPPECDGFGMCILENFSPTSAEECEKYENCIRAEMDYADEELVLVVSEKKIKDKAYVKYFTKEYFELEKDFTLTDEMAESLECPKGTTLPKGKYPINEENGKIVVRFKL